MGKLIKMGVQEKRLLWPRWLHWNRLLFLLGLLIMGSTYQYLRRPWGLPSLWAEVSSQQPIKLASRDLPNDVMTIVSTDPPKASSEMEAEMLAPQATLGRNQATLRMTMENKPRTPRRIAKITPPTPKNNHSPTAADTERMKENTPTTPSRVLNHYTPISSRQTVKHYSPSSRGEMKSYNRIQARGKVKITPTPPGETIDTNAPSTLMTMETPHAIIPRTKVKDSETMATYEILETSSPKRILEETSSAILKRIIKNTPPFLTEIETNILTSPRRIAEKNTMTSSKRVGNNSSSNPWRLVGKNNQTTLQGADLEHTSAVSERQVTRSTAMGGSPAKNEASTAIRSVRNPLPRTSAPSIRTASATNQELAKKPSTAPRTSVTPQVRANPTVQIRHCVVVEPAPAMPTSPSPSLTTSLFPEVPSPSPSAMLPGWPDHPQGEYPRDLFSVEERQQGWVILHIFGMLYLFVALAIVCDEFFVPALSIITEKLQISEDVAGATFMAAGGSAPELFTSLIGVFISHSNVGIGTIVGSAVFNILFVIGTCSLFSREVLHLTWWPLFRDISFYILDLSVLILFFLDSLIAWWESLLLLLAYALYVFTMKWNKHIEVFVKEQLRKRPVAKVMTLGNRSKACALAVLTGGSSSASLHNNIIRCTFYQLMIHSLDPLGIGKQGLPRPEESLNQEARAQPQAKAESKPEEEPPAELPVVTVTPAPTPDTKGDLEENPGGQEGAAGAENTGEMTGEEGKAPGEQGTKKSGGDGKTEAEEKEDEPKGGGENQAEDGDMKGDKGETGAQEVNAENQDEAQNEKDADDEGGSDGGDSEEEEEDEEEDEEEEEEEEEEKEEPLSLDWPETRQKQAIYLFLLPIVLPLWLTVPDVRRQESKKLFVITFLGSIIWIAMFSYLMVWWAHQVGETIGISEEIMGLTILAAGTSIPDLITSVIVARKGLGDMAVSSSVGSNIFDITVGLPVPWLLFCLINGLQPVPVSSNGLFCAIVLLFLMLLFVISSIALCKWRMNKILGFTMFLLYFVFLIISVMLEDRIISCPVSI
ncbi:sodium/potassium/calcium exchanger 1 [Marmota monax]|uniref:sodium/potassium/calcium exchanger 1 n=1 Tax=Marmota monax TaxID=9995 RepID=UPI001EAFC4A9|nr:sodium/potassium/calcium exchanger 1 [Marmota monax]